jgi:hypothetical protein
VKSSTASTASATSSTTAAAFATSDSNWRPHTRPEEETVFVSESFDLARDAKDWVACALVPWAMHLPQGVEARDIAALLTRQLQLQPGDITVTLNQPEPYLIRFEKASDAKMERDKGRFTSGGTDI